MVPLVVSTLLICNGFLCHNMVSTVMLIIWKQDPSDVKEGSSEISSEEKMEVNEELNAEKQVETISKEVSKIQRVSRNMQGFPIH